MQSNREFRRNSWIVAWIPLIVVAAIVSLFSFAYFFGGFSPTNYTPFYFFPWWIFVPFFFFGLFFFAFRGRCGGGYWWGSRGHYYDAALEVLRERFARGEITKEQYEQMRKDLQDS